MSRAVAILPLEPDYQYGGWSVAGGPVGTSHRPLRFGPRYVRGETRWHHPRSGRLYGDRPCMTLWCGQTVTDLRVRPIASTEDELDGVDVCGTCDGRARGAGQLPQRDGEPPLVFSPQLSKPPKVCPSRKDAKLWAYLAENRDRRVALCRACGAVEAVRAAGGPYNSHAVIAAHAPYELVPPCPTHGWHRLVPSPDGQTAVCACAPPPPPPPPEDLMARLSDDELTDRMGYHPATPVTGPMHDEARRIVLAASHDLVELVPEGRAASVMVTKLEEALMWANKAIAVDTPPDPS